MSAENPTLYDCLIRNQRLVREGAQGKVFQTRHGLRYRLRDVRFVEGIQGYRHYIIPENAETGRVTDLNNECLGARMKDILICPLLDAMGYYSKKRPEKKPRPLAKSTV
ncbi:MAG: hypothetical protein ABIG30_01085 [Candidatus Aenigmatarchaeota archaeon]